MDRVVLVGLPCEGSVPALLLPCAALTLMSTLWTSCQAMSLQPCCRASWGMLASAYHSRFTT